MPSYARILLLYQILTYFFYVTIMNSASICGSLSIRIFVSFKYEHKFFDLLFILTKNHGQKQVNENKY